LLQDREFDCVTEYIVHEEFTKRFSVLFRIFSQQECKQTQNYLSSCSCSLFVTVTAYRESDARVCHSKNISQVQNTHGSSYRLRFRFLIPINNFGFRISTIVKRWEIGHGNSAIGRNLQPFYVRNLFIIYIIVFGATGYSKRNNNLGENSGDVIIIFW
jgi:hypothetical protein